MNAIDATAPVALDHWIAQIGRTACTAWRWRKKGWIQTINIAGKHYVTAASAAEFKARAERGEFAKDIKPPRRGGGRR